jgi:hypothetical protein
MAFLEKRMQLTKTKMSYQNLYKLYRVGIMMLICGYVKDARTQNVSFLADGVDDHIRRSQLLGKTDSTRSFTNRSFWGNYHLLDSVLPGHQSKVYNTGGIKVAFAPVTIVQQTNSHHGYGWNDGGMVPAKGYQLAASAGVSVSAGKFSLQVRPEFVYALNPVFETFPSDHNDIYWERYYHWLNTSDIPERFGNGSWQKLYPGQSSIRYQAGAVSIGLSTENIWWGPGRRNALVMSNNAPGFAHATINTTEPLKTGVGSFEGQLIAGNLSSSGILPPEINRYDINGNRLYVPKRTDERYISGMMLSWQPKWVSGLFIGFTKASYLYQPDISGIADVLPLSGLIKSSTEKNKQKASLGSLFVRYLIPGEKAELYIEYGRTDKAATLINLVGDSQYPRGYVAGIRKLFSLRGKSSFIEFASEFTQLQLPTAELINEGASWYTHPNVRHGYTHNGQVLGAGIGPGSNSQMADISWVKGFNKIGIMIERIARNNDYFYKAFIIIHDYTRKWADISTTVHADWQVAKFLLSSRIGLIRSLNYEWYNFPGLRYFENGYDVLNLHMNLAVSYRF